MSHASGGELSARPVGVIVWDVDGTLIPADLRWLKRSIARNYQLTESQIIFPSKRVHGYTDESIVVDTAIESGIPRHVAEAGIPSFSKTLMEVMDEGTQEFLAEQAPYPGAAETIVKLHEHGYVQTVLTGNIRPAAEFKLRFAGLADLIDFDIGAYGSDSRDRFELPSVVSARFAAKYANALDSGRTVVIGDAPNDIACARQGGFKVVAVAQRISAEELAQYEPDAVIKDLWPESVADALASIGMT